MGWCIFENATGGIKVVNVLKNAGASCDSGFLRENGQEKAG